MNQPLILLGSGGFAREVAAAVAAINTFSPEWNLLGFLDDNPVLHGAEVANLPVLGPLEWAQDHRDVMVVACMGSPKNYACRKTVVDRLDIEQQRYATLVHPGASVGNSCTLGVGSVLLAGAVLTADVRVGSHVTVMPHALLTHDNRVDDFASLTGGVKFAGGVHIEEGAYIGAGAMVDAGVTVGAWSQIGSASLVRHDVPAGQVWLGTPARFHRAATPAGEVGLTENRFT